MKQNEILVFIPTYNEKENAEKLCLEILKLGLDLDLLFLDDNSPDGTGEVLESLAQRYPSVHVIHREGKLGIGSAHFEGIRWAYAHRYPVLITMDCDFTHRPDYIPQFIALSKTYDVVVGSRHVHDHSLLEWNLFRKTLTKLGHLLTKALLRMKYDATGAFRLYRLTNIPQSVFQMVSSKGYSFFFESLYVLNANKLPIGEVPIVLPARTYGHSKMSFKEIWRSLRRLAELAVMAWATHPSHVLKRTPIRVSESVTDPNGAWDQYWVNHEQDDRTIYGRIAGFYRKYIIKRNLNYFVQKYFEPSSSLLHSGCGSGQVDTDLSKKMSITAFDISSSALQLYRTVNEAASKSVRGDLLSLPFKNESFDGIYNLGVMEHFTLNEIKIILSEFNRVIRPYGKMVLFWPPEFGSSVVFLKGVHFVLNRILRKNIKLHPDEITRVQSKRHVASILEAANFSLTKYYFGIRDAFTHSIIVVQKEKSIETSNGSCPEGVAPAQQIGTSYEGTIVHDLVK